MPLRALHLPFFKPHLFVVAHDDDSNNPRYGRQQKQYKAWIAHSTPSNLYTYSTGPEHQSDDNKLYINQQAHYRVTRCRHPIKRSPNDRYR